MGKNLKVREVALTFQRKQTHGLTRLRNKLIKELEDSLDVLVTIRDDKTMDMKARREASKDIIRFGIEVEELINADQMTRLLAEARLGSGTKQLETEDNTPYLDFSTVREPD